MVVIMTQARNLPLAFQNEEDMGWEWTVTIWDLTNRNVVYLEGLVVQMQALNGLVAEDQDIGAKIGNG